MPIIDEAQPAHEFFSRLMAGDLGYRAVGSFHTPSHWIVPRINSLNPQITIFAPDPSVATEAR